MYSCIWMMYVIQFSKSRGAWTFRAYSLLFFHKVMRHKDIYFVRIIGKIRVSKNDSNDKTYRFDLILGNNKKTAVVQLSSIVLRKLAAFFCLRLHLSGVVNHPCNSKFIDKVTVIVAPELILKRLYNHSTGSESVE